MEHQHMGIGNETTDISYKPYKEWINLTAEQWKEIHKARGEAQAKVIKHRNQNQKKTEENDKTNEEKETNKNKNRKHQRRVAFQDEEQKTEEKTMNEE